jgi:hypothetical protein
MASMIEETMTYAHLTILLPARMYPSSGRMDRGLGMVSFFPTQSTIRGESRFTGDSMKFLVV